MAGFKPTNVAVKVRCLIAWLHPYVGGSIEIRTRTVSLPTDFESVMSANSIILPHNKQNIFKVLSAAYPKDRQLTNKER